MSLYKTILLIFLTIFISNCTNKISENAPSKNQVNYWLTKANQSVLLQKQAQPLVFGTKTNAFPTIEIDEKQTFQSMDGFGFTLTGGSAFVINKLPKAEKAKLLQELFSKNGVGVSYLRIGIGATDLSETPFSYDDMPQGQTDENLQFFTLNPDKKDVIPLLKEILAIQPHLKILATPWSPPVWMKDTNSFVGGRLQPKFYGTYARYFVKYIEAMRTEGINIEAITPQNEPLHPANNPSLLMLAEHQLDFLKNHLVPQFQKAKGATKIIIYDHNCDRPNYPLTILNDPSVKPHIWGTAFHLYAGDISTLSKIHDAHPDKHLYFTEQYTGTNGNFGGDLNWHLKNVLIGATRNWSRTVFEWNLATDTTFGPHTLGGCTTCKGALTIGTRIERNVAYYIIAHAAKFIPSGSVRIGSNILGNLQNVAFKTPSGQKVLIVENSGNKDEAFNIRFKGKWTTASLSAGSVATYFW